MSAFAVATAGHVDHGKTALLRALTGIDCDRLPEEKRRGITLDLGFAHLERDGVEISFVDVPGHERFLHNALAGLGGIRLLLLVVAADQGVREQTREHLAVAELLGIPELVVALTRVDLAPGDAADLVELEVDELLQTSRYAGAPVFRVSSLVGEGIAALADELFARARRLGPGSEQALDRAADPVRIPVDRVFVVRGYGLVATGTLLAGIVRPGEPLRIEPGGREVRVRSLESHGRARNEARAGQRVAVLLAGVEADELERGQELVGPGGASAQRRMLARVRWLVDAPLALDASIEVRLHLNARESPARIRPLAPTLLEPGGEGLVEIRTRLPVVAARGDRLVLRRLSPAATLGGGEVLDPRWRRPRTAELAARLATLAADTDSALAGWVDAAGVAGASAPELARRLARSEGSVAARLGALAAEGRLIAGGGRWFAPAPLAELERRAAPLVAELAQRDRLQGGAPKAEVARRLFGRRGAESAEFHFAWLARRKILELMGERVRPAGVRVELSAPETGLAAQLVALYDGAGLEPPSPAEAARRLAANPQMVEGLVRHLVGRGRLLKLAGGLVISAATFDRLRADLAETGWTRFPIGQFKERFGLSRKFAIPLLERLDAVGATRRDGDERVLLGSGRGGPAPTS